nr:unnamed protein product [Spirometra erinaceieuropaei]
MAATPQRFFDEMWRQRQIPQDSKNETIVHLYKWKENRRICNNNPLLNSAGKIFARLLLNRHNSHLEQGLLSESQCVLRQNRGTIDMIFAARLPHADVTEGSVTGSWPFQAYINDCVDTPDCSAVMFADDDDLT